MNREQSAAYIFAQSVCALAEIEGMKADNMIRESLGQPMRHYETDFAAVIEKYDIHHNGVLTIFQEAES